MINPNDVLTYEQLKARVIELESKLLANREAQPVGFYTTVSGRKGVIWHNGAPEDDTAIYTAPPAPAVPAETDLHGARMAVGFNRYIQSGYVDGWNACIAVMLAQDTQPPTDNTPAQFEALAPKQPFKIGDIVRQHIIVNRYDYAKVIYADPCGALDVKEIGTGLCFGWSASMCELAPCKDA